jgi:hypothetical protein
MICEVTNCMCNELSFTNQQGQSVRFPTGRAWVHSGAIYFATHPASLFATAHDCQPHLKEKTRHTGAQRDEKRFCSFKNFRLPARSLSSALAPRIVHSITRRHFGRATRRSLFTSGGVTVARGGLVSHEAALLFGIAASDSKPPTDTAPTAVTKVTCDLGHGSSPFRSVISGP